MIVVVIIGVLAAVSGPSIARSLERSRLADVNRSIVNGFNEARSYAMSTGEVVYAVVSPGANSRIDFVLPQNAGLNPPQALSCAVAVMPALGAGGGGERDDEGGGGGGAVDPVLFSVELSEFGVDQQIQDIAPAGVNILCLSPGGKILGQFGEVLSSDCGDVNYRIYLSRKPLAGGDTCPDLNEMDARNERQINDTYFVDLSYSGQVRVLQ